MKTHPAYYYPNRMLRIILIATEEILGRNGLNAVLNTAYLSQYIEQYPPHNQDMQIPFGYVSALMNAYETIYGPRAGRGVALRVGRACFKYGLREFGPELRLTDLSFRLLPMSERLKQGCMAFAELFNQFTDQRVCIEYGDPIIYWHIERCPLCWERKSDSTVCSLAVGLLQEALYWVSAGKQFLIEERACIAAGDDRCTIVIDKHMMS